VERLPGVGPVSLGKGSGLCRHSF